MAFLGVEAQAMSLEGATFKIEKNKEHTHTFSLFGQIVAIVFLGSKLVNFFRKDTGRGIFMEEADSIFLCV